MMIMRRALLSIVCGWLLLGVGASSSAQPPFEPPGLQRAIVAQERHTGDLLGVPGVVGTAVGVANGRAVVKVYTERPGTPTLPAQVDGVAVDVQVTGRLYALHHRPGHSGGPGGGGDPAPSPEVECGTTERCPRPVPIGVSTGYEGECSAGTIGARVQKGSDVYALSNNHVYAQENEATRGNHVLQPGRYDTNCAADVANNSIGTLDDFVPIVFSTSASNTVDAAIALSSEDKLSKATPADGYGRPKTATVSPALNQRVQKYGRTTQLTRGVITGINATVNVGYSSGTARFVDQIIVESNKPFIKSGDSGSLLVMDPGRDPVGLLFAGNMSGKLAVANEIGEVLNAFGVSIDGE